MYVMDVKMWYVNKYENFYEIFLETLYHIGQQKLIHYSFSEILS